jgi:hypothetical protein
MKAYHIDRFGSVGGIARRSSQDPRPGLKEVLMRVRAGSLNYRDLMVLKGGGRGPRETQEMVFDAHNRAFAFFKGACTRGIYVDCSRNPRHQSPATPMSRFNRATKWNGAGGSLTMKPITRQSFVPAFSIVAAAASLANSNRSSLVIFPNAIRASASRRCGGPFASIAA